MSSEAPDLVELDGWIAEVCAGLGLPAELVEHRQLILDLARDAARAVMRPAAPATAFLVGYAAGRRADEHDPRAAVREAAAVASALADARGQSHKR